MSPNEALKGLPQVEIVKPAMSDEKVEKSKKNKRWKWGSNIENERIVIVVLGKLRRTLPPFFL